MEEWRKVVGFPNYQISSHGRVKSFMRDREQGIVLKGFYNNDGYHIVQLRGGNGETTHLLVHRLVAMAFLPAPRQERDQIDHIDGNRANNFASNLRWVSAFENLSYASLRNKGKAYTAEPVILISPVGKKFSFDYIYRAEKELGISHGNLRQNKKRSGHFIRNFYIAKDNNDSFPSLQQIAEWHEWRVLVHLFPHNTLLKIFPSAQANMTVRFLRDGIKSGSPYNGITASFRMRGKHGYLLVFLSSKECKLNMKEINENQESLATKIYL